MAILEVFEKVKKQRKAAEKKKALKNVAVGAAIGATVGAVAGVLLAPKSGKETREELTVAAGRKPKLHRQRFGRQGCGQQLRFPVLAEQDWLSLRSL